MKRPKRVRIPSEQSEKPGKVLKKKVVVDKKPLVDERLDKDNTVKAAENQNALEL